MSARLRAPGPAQCHLWLHNLLSVVSARASFPSACLSSLSACTHPRSFHRPFPHRRLIIRPVCTPSLSAFPATLRMDSMSPPSSLPPSLPSPPTPARAPPSPVAPPPLLRLAPAAAALPPPPPTAAAPPAQPAAAVSPHEDGAGSTTLPTTVRGLRDMCKSMGLSSNGVKAVLLQRLKDSAHAPEPNPSTPAPTATRAQAPPFNKHEFGRLFHVMALPTLAEAIAASRGPLTRQQKDAREDKVDVWESEVATAFNSDTVFVVPDSCKTFTLDPNNHPFVRDGAKLKMKYREVCFLQQSRVH